MSYFIAYDLGTGGIKASIFDEKGASLGDAFEQYDTWFPHEKWIEQKASDWWKGVCSVTPRLLKESGIPREEIRGLALSGHSLVPVPFDKDGNQLLDQVPIWCDMRASDQVPKFFANLTYEDWYTTTGNGDPEETYTIFKLMWFKEHEPELFGKIAHIIGSKDYVNYKFTGRMCTDPSYASGFGVFNMKAWDYEDRFFEAAGISRDIFPEIIPSDGIVGTVTEAAAAETGLVPGTLVACGAVDNTCMALGSTGIEEGRLYTSLGSSAWIAINSPEPVVDLATRPFVFAHVKKGLFTSAVSIFSAGNSFRWIRDNLCKDLPSDTDAYDKMNEMAENTPIGSNGVLFNPTLAGGSAQEPSPDLKGGFMGLTLGNTREDLVRASMEGVAMALRKTLDILLSQVSASGEMLLCGGGSKSAIWRQIFADIYNMPVVKTNIDQNAASLGAAALAANACGIWNGYDNIQKAHEIQDIKKPIPAHNSQYEEILKTYTRWTEYLAELTK